MEDESTFASDSEAPHGRERRRHPRAALEWPISVALREGQFEARLRDISASGLCFFLDRSIPEMTVLGLEFELADQRIRCKGAVVRCAAISPHIEHYEVAVFLHEIGDGPRRAIESYVGARA